MTLDELIDIQEAGSRACILGLGEHENPYLRVDRRSFDDEARISVCDVSVPLLFRLQRSCGRVWWKSHELIRESLMSSL